MCLKLRLVKRLTKPSSGRRKKKLKSRSDRGLSK